MTFRVKKGDMIQKSIRLPSELAKSLERVAEKNNVSFNNIIIQCCEYALENLEVENDEEA